MATIISTKTSGVGGLEVTGDATGILQLASNNGTTAVTVDASQNVGIGTSSPTALLDVVSSGAVNTFSRVRNSAGIVDTIMLSSGDALLINQTTGKYFSIGTNATERMRITDTGLLQFNSGYGSVATAYGCRAWVNFNGTGTVAIRASGNVSSITDGGTGVYTINFTNAMPDANYNVVTTASHASGVTRSTSCDADNYLTSSVRLTAGYSTAQYDPSVVNASVFR